MAGTRPQEVWEAGIEGRGCRLLICGQGPLETWSCSLCVGDKNRQTETLGTPTFKGHLADRSPMRGPRHRQCGSSQEEESVTEAQSQGVFKKARKMAKRRRKASRDEPTGFSHLEVLASVLTGVSVAEWGQEQMALVPLSGTSTSDTPKTQWPQTTTVQSLGQKVDRAQQGWLMPTHDVTKAGSLSTRVKRPRRCLQPTAGGGWQSTSSLG